MDVLGRATPSLPRGLNVTKSFPHHFQEKRQSINQSIEQSVNQSINQLHSQSINQSGLLSINQSINVWLLTSMLLRVVIQYCHDYVNSFPFCFQGRIEEQERWVLITLGVSGNIFLIGLCLYGLRLMWPAQQRFFTGYLVREKIPPRPFQADIQIYSLTEHLLAIQNIVVDEDRVATSCLAGQLRLWNWNERRALSSVKRMRNAAEEGGFTSSTGAFVRDYMLIEGRRIRALALKNDILTAGCEDGAIEVYHSRSGASLQLIQPTNVPVRALALSVDALFAGRENGELNVFLPLNGEFSPTYTAKLHHAAIGRVALLQDRILTVGYDNCVKVCSFLRFPFLPWLPEHGLGWLIDWLIWRAVSCLSIVWLIDWLILRGINWSIDRLIDWLIDSLCFPCRFYARKISSAFRRCGMRQPM